MTEGAATIRLPEIADADLTSEQRVAVERISAGPRGGVIGPFVPLLRSPELMNRLQLVGAFLRFESQLPDDLFELAVLVVARHWDQQFEWGYHQPLALAAGVPSSVVDDVERGRPPGSGRPELALAWQCLSQVLSVGQVDDEVYDGLVSAIGEAGVVELVATCGYYTTLALTMNVARTPPPLGAPRMHRKES